MSKRISNIPSPHGLELHIRAQKEWGVLIFVPVWFAFWTFGGVQAIKWVVHPTSSAPNLFLILWLVGWAFGEVWAVYVWLWTAFGEEIVQVREGSLKLRRDILDLGRSQTFSLSSVRNLRASGIFPSHSNWENMLIQMKLRGGTVAFDCEGETVRFGIQLTEPEAQEVVAVLKPFLPTP
jgi:hypothetical protein